MNEPRFLRKNAPAQAEPQPPAKQKELEKRRYDLRLNLHSIYYFLKTAVQDPGLCTAAEIRETKEIAREALRSPVLDREISQEARELLFRAFARIIISTKDEEARRAAEEARDSIPYPFGPKYGQVRLKP